MDIINFDYELKKMKKRKILILKELIFELYAFERNKYQLSKLVGITPQAIGPIVDFLNEVELIKISRIEEKRKIPANFYSMDLKSSLSHVNLTETEKNVLIEFLEKFRLIYSELKELENEQRIEKTIENFYEGVVPNTGKMFILQVISSLLILAALILDIDFMNSNPFFNPEFLKSQPGFLAQLERYKEELNSKLSPIPLELEDHITYYSHELQSIYNKVWTELLQLVMFESIMKEPGVTIPITPETKDQGDISKNQLKRIVESYKDYSMKKVDDVLNSEGKQRNTNMKDLNITQKKMLEIMEKVQEDKNLVTELDGFYTKINSFSNKIKTLPIGIMGIDKDKEKVEFLINKIAVEKAVSNIVSEIFDILQKLEKEIQFEGPNINKINSDIDRKMHDVELLMKWAENPNEILGETPSKSKLDKKEIEIRMNKLISELKDISIISEDDFLKEFRENHPNLDVDYKLIKSILNKLVKEKIISGMHKVKVGKDTVIVYILGDTDGDQQELFEFAKHTPSGKITIPRIMDSLGWKEVKARYILDVLKENGHVEYRKTKSEGEIWFIPGILED
ncbi:MAG: hypothetical protein EAX96_20400 [Candidatus Lokiarchaeota archaeon]|nr:hypothetical protein [Candidatus Lokiarchaeota archaeon]